MKVEGDRQGKGGRGCERGTKRGKANETRGKDNQGGRKREKEWRMEEVDERRGER